MCHPGYVSHPGDTDHEWPYRCTSCSVMHAADEGKVYYQNRRGQECCNKCPRNTAIVGSIATNVPDSIRKCVCLRAHFTMYVNFGEEMTLFDPTEGKDTKPFPYPTAMPGYECEPCHQKKYLMVFQPEKKGMYCGEPTINGVINTINDEDEGCSSEYNPVCVQNFATLCRVYCPGGAVFPEAMPWFYLPNPI